MRSFNFRDGDWAGGVSMSRRSQCNLHTWSNGNRTVNERDEKRNFAGLLCHE